MSIPPLAESEYETLRATIRERGTMRIYVVLVGITSWGALAATVLFAGFQGVIIAVPLLVLATAFELNFYVYSVVERIGRYIQVFYEEPNAWSGWETTAMKYGAAFPAGFDPLFFNIFAIGGAVNFFTSFEVATPGWRATSLLLHAAFAYRIVTARKAAAVQRTLDLDRFRSLLSK